MKTTLLRSIRAETKAWWYHRQLREQGQITEALKREHESMRRELETIRTALLATIGRGGSTIYLSNGSRITASWPIPVIDHLACPIVDLRTIPDDKIVQFAVRGPMVDPTRTKDEGTGAFDWVTTKTYIRLAHTAGAEVRNVLHPTP